jgi:hypothetical protein
VGCGGENLGPAAREDRVRAEAGPLRRKQAGGMAEGDDLRSGC